MRINWQRLGEIFTSSFSPDSLIKVKRQRDDFQEQKEPLLAVLKEDGFSFYLWSEGDKNWQKKKFEQVEAARWVREIKCFFFSKKKVEGLPEIIKRIFNQEEGLLREDILIIIVDDKKENLERAADVLERSQPSVEWLPYHFKISDPQADANAFYLWLQQVRRENPNKRIEIILDFDNVVIDTNGVLLNVVPENILRLITSFDNPYSTGAVE